ncbi:hypothetical protein [Protaetiibacter mangrovi]|uniref:Uncharacterized protein n=1 Tax=Protaetiibacter mangrovi TaxID=2970926 RepID=A0ABT1ZBC0_9MICO|nr:hypothetical protein [Protaetiibacter mangrovi]MCS0498008.1 hypothetical protein [Protaetiibacter mangrovi]TPX03380.1 hypothetical protein FJ656_17485 [Schumannella luteola]
MDDRRSDQERIADALRARASLEGEEFSAGELLEGGAGAAEHLYLPGDPLAEGEELVEDAEGDEA